MLGTLSRQFMLASLLVLIAAMVGLGWWVGQQIETGVVQRTAATTAVFVDSFVSPQLQELGQGGVLPPDRERTLNWLLRGTPLGQQIVVFKVWDREGRVVYSTEPGEAGQSFPVRGNLVRAFQGEVGARLSHLEEDENIAEREKWSRLLEIYSPVRLQNTDQIIAVAEFYHQADALERDVAAAQRDSWLVVALAMLATYLLLAGIVRRGSNTIARQQSELSDKVAMLSGLLAQNEELHDRVRRAATRTTELNERFLRRVSAELHDGPAQDLGLALLRLDMARTRLAQCPQSCPEREGGERGEDLEVVKSSLSHALQEIRSIASGLRLPELEGLGLAEALSRVVRAHERRTGSKVALELRDLPEQVPLPVKIALYRLIQEALSNGYRHGRGVGLRVRAECDGDHLRVEVSDRGPGFHWAEVRSKEQHLGLVGMRERMESLGGTFRVESEVGLGTTVMAILPWRRLQEDATVSSQEDEHER